MEKKLKPIVLPNATAFLPGVQAAVVFKNSRDIFSAPDAEPISVNFKEHPKLRRVVPWGEDNDLPQLIITKAEKSPDLSTGLLFNVQVGYGDGIIACKYEIDEKGKKTVIPVYDNQEINDFFEYNDINGYLLEQLTDINYFYNVFPEIILNQESPESRKVVELNSKEAAFSRWEEMNPETGIIENHLYNAKWEGGAPKEEETTVTQALNAKRPIPDILQRIGREPRDDAKTIDDQVFRYIVPVSFNTPGRTYYQKPYWYSIIESGWYDFATYIPDFKKYLIKNGMTLRHIIYLADDYFDRIFSDEGITDKAKQKARIKTEYDNINTFLTGLENTGKSVISYYKPGIGLDSGKKTYRFEIQTIENKFSGGEYLKDSGEVSNMMGYALGVHHSLIGSTPGGSSASFSGSDKRELFIIKQALIKPIRDRILRPLYLIKKVNKWPEDIYFTIPNIELTTLDKEKTGVETKA
jgi:hypothetical protein